MTSSAATARTTAGPIRRPAPERPKLHLVTPLSGRRSNLPFILLCASLLTVGLLVVLLLNLSLSQGAYELHDLQKRSALAADTEAALQSDIASVSTAGQLAQKAGQLGMVPAGTAIFLNLEDGKVLGVAPKEPVKDPLKVVGEGESRTTPVAPPATGAPPAGTRPSGAPTTRGDGRRG